MQRDLAGVGEEWGTRVRDGGSGDGDGSEMG